MPSGRMTAAVLIASPAVWYPKNVITHKYAPTTIATAGRKMSLHITSVTAREMATAVCVL